jgi:hypothetical protein
MRRLLALQVKKEVMHSGHELQMQKKQRSCANRTRCCLLPIGHVMHTTQQLVYAALQVRAMHVGNLHGCLHMSCELNSSEQHQELVQ